MRNELRRKATFLSLVSILLMAAVSAAYAQVDSKTPEAKAEATLNEDTTLEFVDTPFEDVLNFLVDQHAIKIELAPETKAGAKRIDPQMPLTKNLKQVTLRSALHLLLDEHDLEVTVTPQGGLLIMPSTPLLRSRRVESFSQKLAREILEKNLRSKQEKLEFLDTRLRDVIAYLADVSDSTIVLDSRSLAAAKVAPDTSISLVQPALPLGQMLKCILLPLDLQATIQDEVILIVQRDPKAKFAPSADVAIALAMRLDVDLNKPLPAFAAHLTEKTGVPFALHYPDLKAAGIDVEKSLAVKTELATPAQVLQALRTSTPLKLVELDGIVLITAERPK